MWNPLGQAKYIVKSWYITVEVICIKAFLTILLVGVWSKIVLFDCMHSIRSCYQMKMFIPRDWLPMIDCRYSMIASTIPKIGLSQGTQQWPASIALFLLTLRLLVNDRHSRTHCLQQSSVSRTMPIATLLLRGLFIDWTYITHQC